MNNDTRQYPAALYSAVSEIGYRSGRGVQRGAHRRSRIARLRQAFAHDGSRRNPRLVVIHPMHEAR
jgi:hypothetical protein